MQRVIDEQSREIEEMQNEFNNAGGLMNDKYAALNERFLEL
jgi:hypothetical protein